MQALECSPPSRNGAVKLSSKYSSSILSKQPSSRFTNLSTHTFEHASGLETAKSSVSILFFDNGEEIVCSVDDRATRNNENIVKFIRNQDSHSSFSSILTGGILDLYSESESDAFLVPIPKLPESENIDFFNESEPPFFESASSLDVVNISKCTNFPLFAQSKLINIPLGNILDVDYASFSPSAPTILIGSDDTIVSHPVVYNIPNDVISRNPRVSNEIASATEGNMEIKAESSSLSITKNTLAHVSNTGCGLVII